MNYRRIAFVSIGAIVVLLLITLGIRQISYAPPPPPTATQHETPIIIQGGSLRIWSAAPFKDGAPHQRVTTIGSSITLIDQFKDGTLTSTHQTYRPMPASWAICTGDPHFARITPVATNHIALDSWGQFAGLDMFSENDVLGDAHPYREVHKKYGTDMLGNVFIGQGDCKGITASASACLGDLSNTPCFISCPSGICWIGLGYQ